MLTGSLLLVAGVLLLPSSTRTNLGTVPPPSPQTDVGSPTAVTKTPAPTATNAPAAPGLKTPVAEPAAGRPFAPLTVQVPRARIFARVLPVSVGSDRMLTIPEDVRQVGWWRAGAAAGASSGTVVLVGHVDSARQGPGAFFPLRQMEPGDRVVLGGAGGQEAVYVVAARRRYPKNELPRVEVFGQGSTPRLVLLTCGGRFDSTTGHYEDNVVVYATPRA